MARREHSLAELRDKLAAREFPPAEVAELLDSLAAAGLASDERFAESFVRSRIRKGQGPLRIRAELQRRGIEAMLADAALEEVCEWGALAREVRQRRFGAEAPAGFEERARQMRFLEYRGFTSGQIRASFTAEDDPG